MTANGNGSGNGKGKPAAPKGREAFRNQRRESEVRSPRASVGAGRRPRAGSGRSGDWDSARALGPGSRRVRRRGTPRLCSRDSCPVPPAEGRGAPLSSGSRESAVASVPQASQIFISLGLCSPWKQELESRLRTGTGAEGSREARAGGGGGAAGLESRLAAGLLPCPPHPSRRPRPLPSRVKGDGLQAPAVPSGVFGRTDLGYS